MEARMGRPKVARGEGGRAPGSRSRSEPSSPEWGDRADTYVMTQTTDAPHGASFLFDTIDPGARVARPCLPTNATPWRRHTSSLKPRRILRTSKRKWSQLIVAISDGGQDGPTEGSQGRRRPSPWFAKSK